MSYQPCDKEGEPLPGTELKEVSSNSSFLQFLLSRPFKVIPVTSSVILRYGELLKLLRMTDFDTLTLGTR